MVTEYEKTLLTMQLKYSARIQEWKVVFQLGASEVAFLKEFWEYNLQNRVTEYKKKHLDIWKIPQESKSEKLYFDRE